MGAANIAEIALQLMRHGMPPGLPVMAVSAATTPRETRLSPPWARIARRCGEGAARRTGAVRDRPCGRALYGDRRDGAGLRGAGMADYA